MWFLIEMRPRSILFVTYVFFYWIQQILLSGINLRVPSFNLRRALFVSICSLIFFLPCFRRIVQPMLRHNWVGSLLIQKDLLSSFIQHHIISWGLEWFSFHFHICMLNWRDHNCTVVIAIVGVYHISWCDLRRTGISADMAD